MSELPAFEQVDRRAEEHDAPNEETDSDIDADISRAHGPKTTSEKRKAQNMIMRAFVADLSTRLTQKEVKEAVAKSVSEERQSIQDILAAQDSSVPIVNPRDYQTELFQRAKNENIIAVLDTGSGKTHIATLLLRHILDEELENRARENGHKIAFFLVNSVSLVFQQQNVLRCGLDQKVKAICGDMNPALWAKSTWQKHFEEHMIIVCTAEILYQCLMHSFIRITQINLLIFDEAHHAKGNHPYARVMKDFYWKEPADLSRPRIFGMTASPVDVKGLSSDHIKEAARGLETLLCARIVTAAESTLALSKIHRPTEQVALYAPLLNEYETAFYQKVKARYGKIKAFEKYFLASKRYSSELGRWASDAYWTLVYSEAQSAKLQNREHSRFNQKKKVGSVEEWDREASLLKEADEFFLQHNFGMPTLSGQDVSSKVQRLYHWLNLYFERSDEARCIVFVEQRQTARLLLLLFQHLGGPNLHCGLLVGASSYGEQNLTLREQVLTVSKFRHGTLNCLFATSVAEEGLDIPQCNLVVRFDLYRTMIGYVQSRGRARHRNSTYLHMLEKGNNTHKARLMNVIEDEQAMKKFCQELSHSQRIFETDKDELDMLLSNELFPVHIEPKSGAKLTYRSSLSVLHHFVATWPYPNHATMLQPTYVICPSFTNDIHDLQKKGFICEVMLPEGSPLISVTGEAQSRKTIAKCAAAFKTCLLLRQKDLLDESLLPTTAKRIPKMASALLAVSEKKKYSYPMLIKPDFWKRCRDTVPDHLFLTIINFDTGLDRPHQPLGLLTRVKLPQLPEFPIYLSDGRASDVSSYAFDTPISVCAKTLKLLTTFTLRIYEDIFHKVYDNDVRRLSYWIAPVLSGQASMRSPIMSLDEVLDMEQIYEVSREPFWQWTSEAKSENLINRYFIDPFHGGRRYYSTRIALHLEPDDPVPAHVPRQGHKYMNSILEYTDSKWAKSRDISKWNRLQPVVEVERIPFRRNYLARTEDKEQNEFRDLRGYICPEPLRISKLATSFVVTCYVLPAIIHRFESYLIALEGCQALHFNLCPALALEALTKDSENSDDHGEEQINFKSGMGPNYERLEFLGDCFLKMATSISVFVQRPDDNEFEFHVRRMEMLCNKNLMEVATGKKDDESIDDPERNLQIYQYIRTAAYSRRTWYPEGLKLLIGKGSKKSEDDWLKLTHNLSDKSIADVCEAFIGATFMEHHDENSWDARHWDDAVRAVKLFVNSKDHLMSTWTDYYAAYSKPDYQVADATSAMKNMALQIEKQHGYHFKYPRLLRSAFTHPSYPYMFENIPNYQRLEFLGDSLLDMAFIMHLFWKYPEKDPHWLTEHKTPMVSNKFLGAVCVKLGWHTHIRQNTSMLTSQIRDYVVELEEAEREANGAMDYWVSVSEPPKCLADVIEAYVAALFVDAEFDFSVVQHFFTLHLKPFFADMTVESYENFSSTHPTTRLNRLLSINFGCMEWRLGVLQTTNFLPSRAKTVTAMILIHGQVHFYSLGQSGKYARVRASRNALDKLDGLPPFEFRRMYKCDCKPSKEPLDEVAEKLKETRIKEAMGPDI